MSPLQGLGAEGLPQGALQWVEGWLLSVCLPVKASGFAMCCAWRPIKSSLLSPGSPDPACCRLLRDPLFPTFASTASLGPAFGKCPHTSALWPSCPGALACPADLPPRRHVVGWLGLRRPTHPTRRPHGPRLGDHRPAVQPWLSGCAYRPPGRAVRTPAGKGDGCHCPAPFNG